LSVLIFARQRQRDGFTGKNMNTESMEPRRTRRTQKVGMRSDLKHWEMHCLISSVISNFLRRLRIGTQLCVKWFYYWSELMKPPSNFWKLQKIFVCYWVA